MVKRWTILLVALGVGLVPCKASPVQERPDTSTIRADTIFVGMSYDQALGVVASSGVKGWAANCRELERFSRPDRRLLIESPWELRDGTILRLTGRGGSRDALHLTDIEIGMSESAGEAGPPRFKKVQNFRRLRVSDWQR